VVGEADRAGHRPQRAGMAAAQVRRSPEHTSHPGGLARIAVVGRRRAAEEGDPEAERQRRGRGDGGQGRDRCAQDRARGDQQQPPVAAAQQPPPAPARAPAAAPGRLPGPWTPSTTTPRRSRPRSTPAPLGRRGRPVPTAQARPGGPHPPPGPAARPAAPAAARPEAGAGPPPHRPRRRPNWRAPAARRPGPGRTPAAPPQPGPTRTQPVGSGLGCRITKLSRPR
jgi:hypothetical protein